MKIKIIWIGLWCMAGSLGFNAHGQLLSWSPAFPKATDAIKITLDASKGNKGLLDFSGNVYVHIGVITSASKNGTDWRYAPFTWGGTAPASQALSKGQNKWEYSIPNLRSFLNVPANETILSLAILFRAGGCTNCAAQRNSDGTDMYVPIYNDALAIRFEQPPIIPYYQPAIEPIQAAVGQPLSVKAVSSQPVNWELKLNQQTIHQNIAQDSISMVLNLATAGNYLVTAIATQGNTTLRDSFSFLIGGTVITAALPAGVNPGINYEAGDTSVTLVLNAPQKTKVAVIGDFPGNDWTENLDHLMFNTPDKQYWWLRLTGLIPGKEYAFQYLIDGSLKITDPYVEKVLDPFNDGFIPASAYPQLMPYPTAKTSGMVGIFQTQKPGYNWKNNFTRPDKTNLIVYEMLLRDFIANHDWNTLTDSLNYFSSLGINAIELMPVQEFDGNLSWGYNPAFFFAADKYYGPENSLKRFIDSCHGRGIAVILDMVLNHATNSCPLAALYWDGANNRPAADNPWFNPVARHPFNVFNDFNHESPDTKYFSTRVMEFWLKEYRIDGYRFDLSKGFTQKNNPTDVNAWSAYDAGRVNIWRQYYDSIQRYSPGAYVILEHFADNAEEFSLSESGMLLWGNVNHAYSEATKGNVGASNFQSSLYTQKGWIKPHLVSYMESHDEERLMYLNLQFGNSSGAYSTKNFNTAIDRNKMAASFFLLSPGPKMIWQFGELGYDYSINTCENGTINNSCRLDNKPLAWPYLNNPKRIELLDWYKTLILFRNSKMFNNNFSKSTISHRLGTAVKYLSIQSDSIKTVVVGNFDVNPVTSNIEFPKTGIWYDLKDNTSISITSLTTNMSFQPGEYHVYTDKSPSLSTPVDNLKRIDLVARITPNPSSGLARLEVNLDHPSQVVILLTALDGKQVSPLYRGFMPGGFNQLNLPHGLAQGMYLITFQTSLGYTSLKWINTNQP
ncbi:MAG: alpha-amylase family glycosyl hydrolase [Saprospiraceae bacterium]|nr:alpha-amylase family glycosyl hydrolase [Saprospiraceae bacterium]